NMDRTGSHVRTERALCKIDPIRNHDRRPRPQRRKALENLRGRRDPSIHPAVERMVADGIKQMPREYQSGFHPPKSGGDDGVIPGDMSVHHIKWIGFKKMPQPKRGIDVDGIEERKLNVRLYWPAPAPRD